MLSVEGLTAISNFLATGNIQAFEDWLVPAAEERSQFDEERAEALTLRLLLLDVDAGFRDMDDLRTAALEILMHQSRSAPLTTTTLNNRAIASVPMLASLSHRSRSHAS